MISILIPTYNYNISELIASLHKQLSSSSVVFEIIIFEDGSTTFINTIDKYNNTKIIFSKKNIGRVKARQALAFEAKYDWLLFLDADVLPKHDTFITQHLEALKLNYDAIFGGFAYYKMPPKKEYMLRWKYGRNNEEILAKKRNSNPYKVIISANYLIKKTVFLEINKHIEDTKTYGFDNYFGALLQQHKVNVLHLDNPVYHLGIEKSEVYLKKKEMSALTLLHFYNSNSFNTNNSNDLLKLFLTIKRLKLLWLFSLIYTVFGSKLKKHLVGTNPLITLLQTYKILFMCNAYYKKN